MTCRPQGEHGLLVGLPWDEIATTPLSQVLANRKPLDTRLLELMRVLARWRVLARRRVRARGRVRAR